MIFETLTFSPSVNLLQVGARHRQHRLRLGQMLSLKVDFRWERAPYCSVSFAAIGLDRCLSQ